MGYVRQGQEACAGRLVGVLCFAARKHGLVRVTSEGDGGLVLACGLRPERLIVWVIKVDPPPCHGRARGGRGWQLGEADACIIAILE